MIPSSGFPSAVRRGLTSGLGCATASQAASMRATQPGVQRLETRTKGGKIAPKRPTGHLPVDSSFPLRKTARALYTAFRFCVNGRVGAGGLGYGRVAHPFYVLLENTLKP